MRRSKCQSGDRGFGRAVIWNGRRECYRLRADLVFIGSFGTVIGRAGDRACTGCGARNIFRESINSDR